MRKTTKSGRCKHLVTSFFTVCCKQFNELLLVHVFLLSKNQQKEGKYFSSKDGVKKLYISKGCLYKQALLLLSCQSISDHGDLLQTNFFSLSQATFKQIRIRLFQTNDSLLNILLTSSIVCVNHHEAKN